MEIIIFLSFLAMAYLLIKVNSQAEEIYYLRFPDLSPEPVIFDSKPFDWQKDAEYLND